MRKEKNAGGNKVYHSFAEKKWQNSTNRQAFNPSNLNNLHPYYCSYLTEDLVFLRRKPKLI